MPYYLKSIGVLTLTLLSFFVHAKGERYGGSLSMRNMNTDVHVQGESKASKMPQFGLVHTRPIDENNNRWRWWISAHYLDEQLTSPKSYIYQESKGLELRIMPQYAIASWDGVTPFMGAGVSLAYQDYSNRWQVDEQGYKYGHQLEDISQLDAGVLFNFGTAIKFGKNPNSHLQLVPQFSSIFPMNGNSVGIELSLSLLF